MNKIPSPILRFLKYTFVGSSTFAFDLLLLFILADIFHVHYLIAAGLAFLITVSINYLISRTYVFSGTRRSMYTGYFIFMCIAVCGLVAITGMMAVLVGFYHMYYLYARVITAAVVGIGNYLSNLYLNFNVEG